MRRAFTLVELLVVIGIIAALLGILLPAIGRAQERARQLQCATNIRTILQGEVLYRSSSKGRCIWMGKPGVTNHFDRANLNSSVYFFSGTETLRYGMLIDEGSVVKESFLCPSSPAKEDGIVAATFGVSSVVPAGAKNGTYAMRGAAEGAPVRPPEFAKIKALISDFEFRDQRTPPLYPNLICHPGGMNVGFTDAHVEFVNGAFDSFFYQFGGDRVLPFAEGTWSQFDRLYR
jgi:prepilin-type N-terminal cleavage/methylation domain-containing protein/prepilin-type processing-associated H-X9-DG protein